MFVSSRSRLSGRRAAWPEPRRTAQARRGIARIVNTAGVVSMISELWLGILLTLAVIGSRCLGSALHVVSWTILGTDAVSMTEGCDIGNKRVAGVGWLEKTRGTSPVRSSVFDIAKLSYFAGIGEALQMMDNSPSLWNSV